MFSRNFTKILQNTILCRTISMQLLLKGHLFSRHTKLSEKLTFPAPDQGVRNVSFSESFAYALNE